MHYHGELAREQTRVALAHKVLLDRDRIELLVVLFEDFLRHIRSKQLLHRVNISSTHKLRLAYWPYACGGGCEEPGARRAALDDDRVRDVHFRLPLPELRVDPKGITLITHTYTHTYALISGVIALGKHDKLAVKHALDPALLLDLGALRDLLHEVDAPEPRATNSISSSSSSSSN